MYKLTRHFITLVFVLAFQTTDVLSQNVLQPDELLSLEYVRTTDLSPDGKTLIYTVSTPRNANEPAGGARSKYYVMNLKDKEGKLLFKEDLKGSSPKWSPDGKWIGYLLKEKGKQKQVYAMPVESGEAIQITNAETDVLSFEWNPGGNGLAFLAGDPVSEKEKELKKRGYDFIFYEENLKNNNLFLCDFSEGFKGLKTNKLSEGEMVWDFAFSPDGKQIAFTTSEENLIDQKYMFRDIKVYDIADKSTKQVRQTEGKLGNYAFSPNGRYLVYTAALNINDHAVSQVYLYDFNADVTNNLTPDNFKGHVSWAGWKSNKEVVYFSGEGVYPKLSLVSIKGGEREVILDAASTGIIFGTPVYNKKFNQFVFSASTPTDFSNLYTWDGKGELIKITHVNGWLADKKLGKQEIIKYTARDGMEIEGLLMLPVNYKAGEKYPLVLFVHGGPESHHSNGWLSRYSTPGQVMAGKGYMVAYINYRASTGYGVPFGMEGFEDPAGKEFDDLADAIDFLIAEKGADKERIGMAGGSYGGYAAAWFATYYTDYVKAVSMFVGISDLISKRGTTDIAWEELLVHSGKPLEKQWQMNLERSPVYWAHQSKTATLIIGGADDPRVHPAQSMELFRRMKMNDHPAVRLVQYPGEGHGNRKQVGRIDVIHRQIAWFDWYVKDMKPLEGPMPPLDISDKYGLDWKY